jgi:hypothetical protein
LSRTFRDSVEKSLEPEKLSKPISTPPDTARKQVFALPFKNGSHLTLRQMQAASIQTSG